ncbi:ParB N-terminal domain-containing protein [Rhizobium nepotum]|uniref:ParB/RepB/Spo0J family partition protein n=1 Tax=Rhizobium nepotum TaxID=1035271 RepID=UPI003369CFD8
MQIELLSPQLIDVSSDAKKVSPDAIQALAESFQQIGQRVPVEVVAGTEGRYRLVFGAKRLAAAASLGIDISAIVRQPDEFANDAQIRLTSISETLYRHELTALEHSVDVADWCAIWRAANPVRRGPKPKQELGAESALNSDDETVATAEAFSGTFSEAAQRFLKISRRNVFNALKIAGIPADLRERIALDDGLADNQQTLLDIAGQPYERASRIVELLISGEATNYADAIAIIDQIPRANPLAAWEKLNDRFTRLKPAEQDAFFALNEASVMRWIAERKAARR